ncbi:MAG TPA: SBBP repeat-containing protein [Acidobacteriota bacterium]|nr:SBBP repeat-containing protein [Acidobacteriota bacterium]
MAFLRQSIALLRWQDSESSQLRSNDPQIFRLGFVFRRITSVSRYCRVVWLLSASLLGPAATSAGAETVQYLSYLGGAQADSLAGAAVGPDGDLYVAGTTSSDNLPAAGRYQTARKGGQDVFVVRLRGADRSLVWVSYLGGSRDDTVADVAVDSNGNVVVAGVTWSDDFPVSTDAFQSSLEGRTDGFVAGLSADGKTLQFSTYLGGSADDEASCLILDADGKPVVAGITRSGDLRVRAAVQKTLGGARDVFLARLSTDGRSVDYLTYMGGNRDDQPFDLALNEQGHLLVTGSTASDENFPLVNPLQESRSGSSDAFVLELDPSGDSVLFSSYLGGRGGETGYCVVPTPSGELLIGGETSSSDLGLVDPIQSAYVGSGDAFVIRIAADYSAVDFATYLGGAGNDSLRDCRLDEFGRLNGVGVTVSPDFPLVGTARSELSGPADLSFVVVDPRRATLDFSSLLGGSGTEIPGGMTTADGTLIAAGVTTSTDLPAFGGPREQLRFPGGGMYRSINEGAQWSQTPTATTDPNVEAVAVHPVKSWVFVGTTGSGVFVSKDQGESWEPLGPGAVRVLSIGLDPTDPQVVFAGGATALWRTLDGGGSWQRLGQPQEEGEEPVLPAVLYTAVAIDPKHPSTVYVGTQGQGIFKSTDKGDTWNVASEGLSGDALTIYRLVFHPGNPNILFAGTNGSLQKTQDGGQSWTATSLSGVGQVRGVAVDPTAPDTLYASGVFPKVGAGVAKSSDGGATWSVSPTPPTGVRLAGVITDLQMRPGNPQVLLAATAADGVLHTLDAGATWSSASAGLGTKTVLGLAVDPGHPERWYAVYQSVSAGVLTALRPQNIFYFPQVADGANGRIAFRTAFALVNTGPECPAVLEFFSSAGEPMTLSLEGEPPAERLELRLPAGGGFYASTPGTEAGLRVGYARVTAGPGVDGTAIFSRMDRQENVTLFEAGVPATQAGGDFFFLVDSIGDTNSGVALVNVADGLPGEPDPAPVRLRLLDEEGAWLAETTVELARGEHLPRFADEIFPEVRQKALEMRGMVAVESPVPLAALTLRQRDRVDKEFPEEVATLTPFPVIAPLNRSRTLHFPQVADGEFIDPSGKNPPSSFTTAFFVANPASSPVPNNRVVLNFFKSDGTAMGLRVGGERPVSGVVAELSPGGFQVVETRGIDSPQVGYARLGAVAPFLGGTAVYSQKDVISGVNVLEAGVAAVSPRRRFSILVDSLGPWNTGLALVNTGVDPAVVTLRLYDLEHKLLGERVLDMVTPGNPPQYWLGPNAHLPRYVHEFFFGLVAEAAEMRGVLTVESSQPLAAVTLRQRVGKSFPEDVTTLTTFPVIPGVPPE